MFRKFTIRETDGRGKTVTITTALGVQKIAAPLELAAILEESVIVLTNTTPNQPQLAWVWISAKCIAGALKLSQLGAKTRNAKHTYGTCNRPPIGNNGRRANNGAHGVPMR